MDIGRWRSALVPIAAGGGLIALLGLWQVPAGRANAAVSAQLVVAPEGHGADCTTSRPCSIATGQAIARAQAGHVPVDVTLMGGTYQLGQPLRFSARDSGTAGDPVVYEAAPGARPVLSGGIPVSGWTETNSGAGIWAAPVPAGTESRELYVNGVRLARAGTTSLPGVWHQTADGYETTDPSIASWRNPSNVELVFSQGNGFWTEPRCDIASMTTTAVGTDVTVRQPCWSNLHIPDAPAQVTNPADANGDNAMGGFEGISAATNPSSIENAYELLTSPGQWYLDQPSHTVYFVARPGEDPNAESFTMPTLQSLVAGIGTLDAPVQYLTLKGITFAYTTWLQPSGNDGFAEMQANFTLTGTNASGSDPGSGKIPEGTCQYTQPQGTCPFAAWTEEPAAVSFQTAHDVSLVGDTFQHLGAAGITFDDGSQNDVVQGNEITDTSGSGIQLGNTDDAQPLGGDPREINSANTVADNWIHGVAAEYPGGVGIWVGYTRQTSIAHNELDNLPYSGISFGWGGWHTDTLHPDNPSIVGDNSITDNLIYNYLSTLPDGGAIYTNGTQGPFDPAGPPADPFLTPSTSSDQMARGLTISGNVALVATWSEFAYYNDEGSDYVTWDSNVEYQNHALATGGCDTVGHILIEDNYWAQPVDGLGGYICPPPPVDVVVAKHHVIPDHPGPGDIPRRILTSAGLEPEFRYLVTSRAPVVTGVGPGGPDYAAGPSTSPVLVSGTGFAPGAAVFFGPPGPDTAAAAVDVLSANYLIASPPAAAGPGQVDVIVQTPSGTSATGPADQYTLIGAQ